MSNADDALKSLEDFLRTKRLKMTEPRRRMVRATLAHPGHFTAEELHQELVEGGERVSIATVYRTLSVLVEAGILEGHDFADGQRRYERLLSREHHDHLVCTDCRLVVEFQNAAIERLQEKVAAANGFSIREHHLTLFVSCDEWAAKGRCDRRPKGADAGRT